MSSNNQPNNIYVGNRYVPIFADPVEWNNLREYEPLTIVTYQGTSYTSRQTVPVGTPLNNTNYWVVTGNYNAQVAQYIQLVNEYKEEVENLSDYLQNVKTIFISDSYGVNNGGWIAQIAATGYMTSDNIIQLAQGGIGFHDEGYLTLLQNYQTEDKNSIQRIVVCGGANDHEMTEAQIGTATSNFVSYARRNYPNAKLYLGHIGWSPNATLRQRYATKTIPGYKACNKYGMTYLTGVEYAMHYYGYFDKDGIHPTNFGCKDLARYIMQALVGGSVTIDWTAPLSTTIWNVQNKSWIWYTECVENELRAITNDVTITYDSATLAANQEIVFGTMTKTDFIYGYPNIIYNATMTTALVNGNTYVPVILGIQQTGTGETQVTFRLFNGLSGVNSIRLLNIPISIKLLYC